MKIKSILLGLVASLVVCVGEAVAQTGALATFPPLTLKSGTPEQIEAFNKSDTTLGLYSKYFNAAKRWRAVTAKPLRK